MDRFSLFVDAGYLISGGGRLCLGTHVRSHFDVDSSGLIVALQKYGEELTRLPHLRTYWYDAALNATPADGHLIVARLPGVKLRLGRLTEFGQKGVDSLIMRDLITLAANRAVATGILVSGDEDLREGVREAQELGMQMHVLGVELSGVADALSQEADNVDFLRKETLTPYFSVKEAASDPREVGRSFAREWLTRATGTERAEVTAGFPRIAMELDAGLIRRASREVAPYLSNSQKEELRAGFWEVVRGQLSGVDETREIGRGFGREWISTASDADRISLKASFPALPPALDRDLISRAAQVVGSVLDQTQREQLHGGFWDVVIGVASPPS